MARSTLNLDVTRRAVSNPDRDSGWDRSHSRSTVSLSKAGAATVAGPVAGTVAPFLRAVALLASVLIIAACSATRLAPWPDTAQGPGYDAATLADLDAARMAIDARETAEAIRLLREVRERLPEDVDVAIALQDAELAHLERGESLDELRAWLEVNPGRVDPDPLREYWTWYLARSRASGEPLDRLLTARVELDRLGALYQLERLAEELPEWIWGHLGLAHSQLLLGQVEAARRSIDRALELDPGNVRVRRMEALVLGREGEDALAIVALDRWLERTENDPLVGLAERDAAILELSAALVDARRYEAARDALNELIAGERFEALPRDVRYDAYLIRSAANADDGQYVEALADAERAALEFPGGLMPHEQRAVLLEYHLDDPDGALEAWQTLEREADLSTEEGRLRTYLYALRARVEQARLSGDG